MTEPVPVIWLSLHEGIDARGPWDTAILERLFDGDEWGHGIEFTHCVGIGTRATIHHLGAEWTKYGPAIVVIPARHHCSPEDIFTINDTLSAWTSVLLILCGDEEGKFPWKDIRHPNIRFWVQMPDPDHYADMHDFGFFFGNGAPLIDDTMGEKTSSYFFSGQATNPRRKAAFDGLRRMRRASGNLQMTDGFARGFERAEYVGKMDRAWMAPAPSGPRSVDTFRAYEALEQGCVPLVDRATPAGENHYWEFVYDEVPFPIIEDWEIVGGIIEDMLPYRHLMSARCSAWWQQRKREMTWRLRHDLAKLGVDVPEQKVTAIITTSPSPHHPTLRIIQETIASVRHHFGDIEIIIACDGVRPEQEHLRERYETYLYDLCRWVEHRTSNIVVYVAEKWRHQAMLTFEALTQLGCNEVLLFLEHDTPLIVDETIDVEKAIETIDMGMLDVLRFHHEAYVLQPHEYLMVDHQTIDLAGLPVRRTRQFSQRPHLAGRDYYLTVLGTHFTRESRTMIEDKMHSVCQSNPWSKNRIAIYHPDTGNIKRSAHLDGRGDESKFEMVY